MESRHAVLAVGGILWITSACTIWLKTKRYRSATCAVNDLRKNDVKLLKRKVRQFLEEFKGLDQIFHDDALEELIKKAFDPSLEDYLLPSQFWFGKLSQRFRLLGRSNSSCVNDERMEKLEGLISEIINTETSSVSLKVRRMICTSLSSITGEPIESLPASMTLPATFFLLDDGTLDWYKLKLPYLLHGWYQTPTDSQLSNIQLKTHKPKFKQSSKKKKQDNIEEKADDATYNESGMEYELTDHEFYARLAPNIKILSQIVDQWFTSLTREEFEEKYKESFDIFPNDQLLLSLFDLHKSGKSYVAFMVAVAQIDAALNDALYIITQGKVLIPKKLRLTLATTHLRSLLGDDIILMLTVLIGPLQGINLRNLLWHGFLRPSEFESHFTSLLLLMIVSLKPLANILKGTNNVTNSDVFEGKRRSVLKVPEWNPKFEFAVTEPSRKGVVLDMDHDGNCLIFPELTLAEIDWIVAEVLQPSFFVLPGYLQFWRDVLELYHYKMYYHALSVLFPVLEHSLRRIFVCANDCVDRLWTAESDVLYSTIDIILAEMIPEDGIYEDTEGLLTGHKPDHSTNNCNNNNIIKPRKPNLLYNEIDHKIMDVLLDLFVWFEGPRVRDKISHGTVDTQSVPSHYAHYLMATALVLALKYHVENTSGSTAEIPTSVKKSRSIMEKCVLFIDQYRSCYHAKSWIQRQMGEFHETWTKFHATLYLYQNPNDPKFDQPSTEKCLVELIRSYSEHIHSTYNTPPLCDITLTEQITDNETRFKISIATTQSLQNWLNRKLNTILNSNEEQMKLGAVKQLIASSKEMLEVIFDWFEKSSEFVKTRKASNTQRKNFQQGTTYLPYFFLEITLMLLVAEEALLNEKQHDVAFVKDCSDCVCRQVSIAKLHVWRKCALLFSCFIGVKQEKVWEEELSHRERDKWWNRFKRVTTQ